MGVNRCGVEDGEGVMLSEARASARSILSGKRRGDNMAGASLAPRHPRTSIYCRFP